MKWGGAKLKYHRPMADEFAPIAFFGALFDEEMYRGSEMQGKCCFIRKQINDSTILRSSQG